MVDLDTAKLKLKMWMDAEDATAMGKSYTIDGLSVTRQDMSTIRAQIAYWSDAVARLSGVRGGLFKQVIAPSMGSWRRR